MALAGFALAFPALLALDHSSPLAVPRATALARVRADPATRTLLARQRVTRTDVLPVDDRLDQVFAYDGARLVLSADVSRSGVVSSVEDVGAARFAFGANIANDPRVLALLCLVFALVTAVWPLRRIRNLDVLASAGLVASLILFNEWRLGETVAVSYPLLGYLALRCAWVGLGPARAGPVSTPLYERLTAGWSPQRRRRLLGLIAGAAAAIVAMVGLTSPNVVDVGYAVMEGATAIVHGLLPYGHVHDIVHGDTYPIGSYLLYVPLAAATPVGDVFASADLTLAAAVAAALAVAGGLSRLPGTPSARRASGGSAREAEGDTAGLRAAIAWLTFPTVLVTVSTGTTDVVLAALMLGGLLAWQRPAWASALVTLAGWFKLAPFALLPLCLARLRGPALARALAACAAVSAAMLTPLLVLGGGHGIGAMFSAIGFQQTRISPHSLWGTIGSTPLQPLVQALTVALVLGAGARIATDRALAADPRRVAALFAAVLLGAQISANYWSYLYLTWIAPFLVASLLAQAPGAAACPGGSARPVERGAAEPLSGEAQRRQLAREPRGR